MSKSQGKLLAEGTCTCTGYHETMLTEKMGTLYVHSNALVFGGIISSRFSVPIKHIMHNEIDNVDSKEFWLDVCYSEYGVQNTLSFKVHSGLIQSSETVARKLHNAILNARKAKAKEFAE